MLRPWNRSAVRRTGLYRRAILTCCLLALQGAVQTSPWMDAGNTRLRHHVQVLADAGIIQSPTSTWPLMWSSVISDVNRANGSVLSPIERRAVNYLRSTFAQQSRPQQFGIALSAGEQMTPIRGFGETRREPQELTAYAEGIGESWAGKLQLSRAKNPQDDKRDRLDGSYLALLHNNLVISLGYQDRWWGPGWQSALALSNNARPVPAISLQRKDPEPFETALLRWLGPWQFAVFAGQLEQDRAVPNAKLLGARLSFRPLRWAEFGLTRTAQWGGEGRPESWQSFQDLLLGDDNRRVNGNVTDDEPGNQLGGIDWRFSKTFSQLSLDFYGEIIGEDEAGGLPANVIGTFGLSAVVPLSSSELRVYLERTDTATRRLRGKAQYNKAYEHAIYQSGYRYYGRSLGASVDNDSRAHHLVAQWYPRFNQDIEIRLSQFDLNTDSVGDNSVSRGNSNDYAASVHYRYQSKSWSTRLGYYHYDGELSLRYADAGDDFAEIALEYHWKIYYADRNPGIFIRATISPQNRLCFYLRHHSNKNLVQV